MRFTNTVKLASNRPAQYKGSVESGLSKSCYLHAHGTKPTEVTQGAKQLDLWQSGVNLKK